MSLTDRNKTKQLVRDAERQNRSAQRDLTRDQRDHDREESRLTSEIKKCAAAGDQQSCNALAKQLLNVRKQRQRNTAVSGRLNAITSQHRMAASMASMGNALETTNKVMTKMNKEMNVADLSKTMQTFDRLQTDMSMREEMMDDILNGDIGEEETDDVVQQVLDEIGINISGEISRAPIGSSSLANTRVKEQESEDLARLQAQLDDLRS